MTSPRSPAASSNQHADPPAEGPVRRSEELRGSYGRLLAGRQLHPGVDAARRGLHVLPQRLWEEAAGLIERGTNPDRLSHEAMAAELTDHLIPGVVLTPGAVGTLPEFAAGWLPLRQMKERGMTMALKAALLGCALSLGVTVDAQASDKIMSGFANDHLLWTKGTSSTPSPEAVSDRSHRTKHDRVAARRNHASSRVRKTTQRGLILGCGVDRLLVRRQGADRPCADRVLPSGRGVSELGQLCLLRPGSAEAAWLGRVR